MACQAKDGIPLSSLRVLLGHHGVTSCDQILVIFKMLVCFENHCPALSDIDRDDLPVFMKEPHHRALKELIRLHDNSASLVHLKYHNEFFGNVGAMFVAHCLKSNSHLKMLKLMFSGIGARGIACLLSAFEMNSRLEEVNLLGNRITTADSIASLVGLCRMIKRNNTLKILKVEFSPMPSHMMIDIADALGKNKTLTTFWMKGGLEHAHHTTLFRGTLQCNTTLSELLFLYRVCPLGNGCREITFMPNDKDVLMGCALNRIGAEALFKGTKKTELGFWPHLLAKIGQTTSMMPPHQCWDGWNADLMFHFLVNMPSLFGFHVNQKKRKRSGCDGGPAEMGNAHPSNDDVFRDSLSCHMPAKVDDQMMWSDDVKLLHLAASNVEQQIVSESLRFAEAWSVLHSKFIKRWGQHRVPEGLRKFADFINNHH